jgi:hypothetical protein
MKCLTAAVLDLEALGLITHGRPPIVAELIAPLLIAMMVRNLVDRYPELA